MTTQHQSQATYQSIRNTGILNKSYQKPTQYSSATNHNEPPSYDSAINSDHTDAFTLPHATQYQHTNGAQYRHSIDRNAVARSKLDDLMQNFESLSQQNQFARQLDSDAERLGIAPRDLLEAMHNAISSGQMNDLVNNDNNLHNNNNTYSHNDDSEYEFKSKEPTSDTDESSALSEHESDNESLLQRIGTVSKYTTTAESNAKKLQRQQQRTQTKLNSKVNGRAKTNVKQTKQVLNAIKDQAINDIQQQQQQHKTPKSIKQTNGHNNNVTPAIQQRDSPQRKRTPTKPYGFEESGNDIEHTDSDTHSEQKSVDDDITHKLDDLSVVEQSKPNKSAKKTPTTPKPSTDTLPPRCENHRRVHKRCPVDCSLRWKQAKLPMPSNDVLQRLDIQQQTKSPKPTPAKSTNNTTTDDGKTQNIDTTTQSQLYDTDDNNTHNEQKSMDIETDNTDNDTAITEQPRSARKSIKKSTTKSPSKQSKSTSQPLKTTTTSSATDLPTLPPRCEDHRRVHKRCPADCSKRWIEANISIPTDDILQLMIQQDLKPGQTPNRNGHTVNKTNEKSVKKTKSTPAKSSAASEPDIIDITGDNTATPTKSTKSRASIKLKQSETDTVVQSTDEPLPPTTQMIEDNTVDTDIIQTNNKTTKINKQLQEQQSSKEPIQLTQWYTHLHALQFDSNGNPYVLLKGTKVGAGPWSSGVITDIVNKNTIVTASGRQYVLNGPINTKLACRLLSPQAIEKFHNGFPNNWSDILINEVNRCKLLDEQGIDYIQHNTAIYEDYEQLKQSNKTPAKPNNKTTTNGTNNTNTTNNTKSNGKTKSTTPSTSNKSKVKPNPFKAAQSPQPDLDTNGTTDNTIESQTTDNTTTTDNTDTTQQTDNKRRRSITHTQPFYATTDVDIATPARKSPKKHKSTHKSTEHKSTQKKSTHATIEYIQPGVTELDSLDNKYKSRSGRTSIKPIHHWETERIVNGILVKGNVDVNTLTPLIQKTKAEYHY